MIKLIFNEVSKQESCTPEMWRRIRINVIHKIKGTKDTSETIAPNCTLPALYKLFSTILYNRLDPRLDQIQSEDQGGFRCSYQAIDHLATYRMIEQKCHVDFMKAFDSINHNSIRDALKTCGVEHEYISLFER